MNFKSTPCTFINSLEWLHFWHFFFYFPPDFMTTERLCWFKFQINCVRLWIWCWKGQKGKNINKNVNVHKTGETSWIENNWNVRCGWQITKYGNIIKRQFLLVHFCYQNVSWTFAHRKYTNKLGSSIWDLAVFSWIVIHRTSRENY